MAIDRGFWRLYDELTEEVNEAIHPSTKGDLRAWYSALDEEPSVAGVVRRLQSGLGVEQWWLVNFEGNHTRQDLTWPDDVDKALGMKLLVMRELARGRVDIGLFGFHIFGRTGGGRPEDTAAEVIKRIFAPMARQLRRYLERELSKAPAADRVVRLDHNSSTYREAIDALERLERVLTEANDYPDAQDKEQKIAEVSAAGRIFRATRVRVGVVVSLLAVPVTYLVKTFAGAAIGEAATKVIDALTLLLGAIF